MRNDYAARCDDSSSRIFFGSRTPLHIRTKHEFDFEEYKIIFGAIFDLFSEDPAFVVRNTIFRPPRPQIAKKFEDISPGRETGAKRPAFTPPIPKGQDLFERSCVGD